MMDKSYGTGRDGSFRPVQNNRQMHGSNYRVAEHGERKIIGKASLHGWEFKANADHVKAHMNQVRFGRSSSPSATLSVPEASNDYLQRY